VREDRAERMAEVIKLIRELWTGNHVEHEGRYYHTRGKLYDPPLQPIPLYIAASARRRWRLRVASVMD
jgi:alkanesulfonate monooxygenase SsuD/methylene tetrahydromethanopterin reductase-like flavin-dependent oxidoreductase (luciferase family)